MMKTLLTALIVCALAGAFPLSLVAEQRGEKSEAGKSESADESADEKTVQTPFGPAAKANRTPPPADKPVDPMVSVTESGDEVTFTRRTPFGSQTWKRKLAELSDHETMLLERSRAAAAKKTTAKTATEVEPAAEAEPAAEKPAP